MIPSPNLDDRTFKDIVDEAIRLIPHYCPEWTNHNPSDPGITMIELFAWMMEMVIYRLNRVPEKVYLTLLDLIGLSLMPPQAARVLLSFTPVERYEHPIQIKRGLQVATAKSDTGEPLIFETIKDLTVSNIKLMGCISTRDGKVTDNLAMLDNMDYRHEGFSLFSGEDEIQRFLYLSDPAFEFLQFNNIINIKFHNANQIKTLSDEIINFLEWEYWDGKRWSAINSARAVPGFKRKDNELFFLGPVEIDVTEIEGINGFFIRGSLLSIPEREKCFEFTDVVTTLIFHGEGLNPDICLCNNENMVFAQIDLSKEFSPFLGVPKYNDTFYIASKEVFSKEDAEINIDVYLSDAENGSRPEPSEFLLLKFEYWNGQNWMELGKATPRGMKEPEGDFEFMDRTYALTRSGKIQFKRPHDFREYEVNGQNSFWVRVRISAGDFGAGGRYIIDDHGKWEWHYDQPCKPPVLSRIKLRYLASGKPLKHMLSYYDFGYKNFSKVLNENFLLKKEEDVKIPYFKVFEINKEKYPITYFGFDKRFNTDGYSLYFRINERKKTRHEPGRSFQTDALDLKMPHFSRSVSLKWEYWNGVKWVDLSVNDYTDNFHESGFIEFIPPDNVQELQSFGKSLYWLRVILESGSFEVNPRILAINCNSVYAENKRTYFNEVIGSSSGAPSQEFTLFHSPILPGLELSVRENEIPPADERELIIKEEGPDCIKVTRNTDGNDEIWIRYHQVKNFYSSTPKSRHYVCDYINNTIIMGDGNNGMIPPRISNNIMVNRYQTGGGSQGNIGHNTINILRENIPYIVSVTNLYPAEGGSDLEDMLSLKSRAMNIFKNLNRAVTAEDYEWLAREASFSVARSKCLSKVNKNGEITVVIVPRPDSDDFDLKKKMMPTLELIRRVRSFLNTRKLVGTKLRVEPPLYCTITLNLNLVFKKDISEIQIVKERIDLTLRRFLHPITGGPDGTGWPFGMPLAKNDIFSVLEKIDEIYYVEEIEIVDDDSGVAVDALGVEEDSLIYINNVNIAERRMQF